MSLACGQAATPPGGTAPTSCTDPDGFNSVGVRRTGRSLRISFSKKTRNAVTVEVFQTAKGRTIVNNKRVARFRNRQRSFIWNGRKTSGKKARVARGVYFVRFRVTDDAKKIDTRRIVVAKRTNGRFYKQGKFVLEHRCPYAQRSTPNDFERPPSGGRSVFGGNSSQARFSVSRSVTLLRPKPARRR